MFLLQVFHPSCDVERSNGSERKPAIFAPGEEPAAGARIGPPRVIVVDVGGKEFDVAPVGGVAQIGSTPPLYYVDTSFRPSYHRLSIAAELIDGGQLPEPTGESPGSEVVRGD